MSEHRPGMGAIPFIGGVAFRVWAPNASAVGVAGTFNGWDPNKSSLESEANGYWYGEVPMAKIGDEYKYAITNGGNTFHRIDPYARKVTNSVGNSIVYDPTAYDWGDDAGFSLPSFNELVVYEMHIGSFVNDGNGPASFQAVMDKFDHLTNLGINVIELMPVMEFAGDYSWGYNPAHIFAVESGYGGPDALKDFVKAAHRRGIGVFVDVVYNHFGPSDLDLWQFDGWSENGKGGIYFYQDGRATTPWGDTRPDYGRPEVRNFIRDNARMWLEEYHLDGLRYDMTPFITSVGGGEVDLPDGWNLMRDINSMVRRDFPGHITIAEDLHRNPQITALDDSGALFHSQWDAEFVHPVREAAITTDDANRDMHAVAAAIGHRFGDDAFSRVIYTESHDEVANGRARVPQEVNDTDPGGWHAQKRSTMAAALVFTSPGIPMLFQGQEFLQGKWFRDDVPLDWHLDEQFRGIVRLYRDLIALRRNQGGVTRGLQGQSVNVFHINDDANVLAFHRWMDGGSGDDVVVVANFSTAPLENYVVGMPYPGQWKLLLNSDAIDYSAQFEGFPATDLEAVPAGHDGLAASATLSIGPYTALIYSRV